MVDDIEAQATEMLRARSSKPRRDVVEAVLAALDAPDACGPPAEPTGPAAHAAARPLPAMPNGDRGVPRSVKIIGAVVLGLGLLGSICIGVIFFLWAPRQDSVRASAARGPPIMAACAVDPTRRTPRRNWRSSTSIGARCASTASTRPTTWPRHSPHRSCWYGTANKRLSCADGA